MADLRKPKKRITVPEEFYDAVRAADVAAAVALYKKALRDALKEKNDVR